MYKLQCKLLQYILASPSLATRLLIRYRAKTMEIEYCISRLESAPVRQLYVSSSAKVNTSEPHAHVYVRFLQLLLFPCFTHIKHNHICHFVAQIVILVGYNL